MALKTLGSNANNSLQAFLVGFNDVIAADLAAITTALKADPPGDTASAYSPVTTAGLIDQTKTGTTRRGGRAFYIKNGVLFVPNRGQLTLRNGDFVCWDTTTGWPIVVSGDAALNGPYTHT
jgi:hypothetical protein